MENKILKVDYRFKILYAVAIIMIVSGHITNSGEITLFANWFPYAGIHIPIFLFSSGYFYKRESTNYYGQYILKKVKTLIIPLYLYNIIYGLFVLLLRLKGFSIGAPLTLRNLFLMPIINGHQFQYNMGGWFVIPLFMAEVYNITLRKLIKRRNVPEGVLFILALILGVIGNNIACGSANSQLSAWQLTLVRFLYFLPFYEFGIFYHYVLETYDKKIPSTWYFAIVFALKIIIASKLGRMPTYTLSWCNDFVDGPFMPIIIGVLGIAFWFRIATILEPAIGKSKFINIIADNTYSIMINQFLGFFLLKSFYAILSSTTHWFQDFDMASFQSNIWWYYIPKNWWYTVSFYVIIGIGFPILVQMGVNLAKANIGKLRKKEA